MVSQRNLIAAKLLCPAVQMAAPHSGAQIAGRIFDLKYRLKNVRRKDVQRNVQALRIKLN